MWNTTRQLRLCYCSSSRGNYWIWPSEIKKMKKRKTKEDWTLSDYKEDAWKMCSLYVRMSEADLHTGWSKCITCEKPYQWKSLQGGHFTPGRRGLNFFDLRGIHSQCLGCNVFKKGNLIKYWPWMIKKYGQEVVDELIENDKIEKHYKKDELIEIKKSFDKLIKEL